jgi:hypothetical protein
MIFILFIIVPFDATKGRLKMTHRVIIEHTQFRTWLAIKPYASTQRDKHALKNKLMKDIKSFYADKWDRLKQSTRDAIDFVVYSSCDRGFSYASAQYLSLNYHASERTVRRIMRELNQASIIAIAYRRFSNLNLTKKPVYFLRNHPYFKRYSFLFAACDQSNDQTYVHTKRPKNVDTAPVEPLNQVSNNVLTNDLTLKNMTKNRIASADRIEEVPDYIPDKFVEQYSYYHPIDIKKINHMWRIAKHQFDRHNIEIDYSTLICRCLFKLVGQIKLHRHIRNKIAYWTTLCNNTAQRQYIDELDALADPNANVDDPPDHRQVSGDDLYSTVQTRTSAWLYS